MAPRTASRWTILAIATIAGSGLMAQAASTGLPGETERICAEPHRISRQEILQAMSAHGAYSLTSTTTSMRFEAEALLAMVRRRQREVPGSTQFLISQPDWFAAHLATAGVTYAEMSPAARAGFEHRQDALIDYGPGVVERVVDGPAPTRSVDVTIFLPDSVSTPAEFSYKDTLSVPPVTMFNKRVIRFKLLEYEDMLVFDQVTGISIRPTGFFAAVFAVLGKPELKQTRLAVGAGEWQVMRVQVSVFPGISKTGTASIEPGGRAHEGIPRGQADLGALAKRMRQPVKLRYGPPSCQARLIMHRGGGKAGDCRRVMGGAGPCAGR